MWRPPSSSSSGGRTSLTFKRRNSRGRRQLTSTSKPVDACWGCASGEVQQRYRSSTAAYGVRCVLNCDLRQGMNESKRRTRLRAVIQMKNALVCVKAKRPYWARKVLTSSPETSDH
jgi:hypothetical protein